MKLAILIAFMAASAMAGETNNLTATWPTNLTVVWNKLLPEGFTRTPIGNSVTNPVIAYWSNAYNILNLVAEVKSRGQIASLGRKP